MVQHCCYDSGVKLPTYGVYRGLCALETEWKIVDRRQSTLTVRESHDTKEDGKKILLIEPPFLRLYKETFSLSRYPLSLGYLAGTICKETTWDVMVYNADFSPTNEPATFSFLAGPGFGNYLNNLKNLEASIWKEVRTTISEYRPSVVGISSKAQNFASACIVARITKEINDRIVVVVGGPHPSMVGGKTLECPNIDVCVIGEGEITIIELLDAIATNAKLNTIRGISYKDNGRTIENPPREPIANLDSLCFPNQSAPEVLKDYDKYPATAFGNIFATRGCPYNCFFCGSRYIWGRKVRFRSSENVASEMSSLRDLGLNSVSFEDDTFGVSREYIRALCSAIIKYCPGLKWDCEMHVKLVNEETVSLMKSAGCFSVQLGVESGNNEILKQMRKGITIEEALSACKIIKKHGLELHTFFMVGFPQETEETLNDTIKAMKEIESNTVVYSIFTPYPGTEAFEFCRRQGLIGDDFDISLYNHQSPANCFCMNLSPQRFRELALRIEKLIDRRNARNTIWQYCSAHRLQKAIRDLGFRRALRYGLRLVKMAATAH